MCFFSGGLHSFYNQPCNQPPPTNINCCPLTPSAAVCGVLCVQTTTAQVMAAGMSALCNTCMWLTGLKTDQVLKIAAETRSQNAKAAAALAAAEAAAGGSGDAAAAEEDAEGGGAAVGEDEEEQQEAEGEAGGCCTSWTLAISTGRFFCGWGLQNPACSRR